MKSLAFLVLLLCVFERSAQEVDQKPQRRDDVQENESKERKISLKELRELVMEQRLGMQILKEELSSTKNELQQQKSEQEALKHELDTLRRENSELRAEQPQVAFSVGLTSSGRVGPFTGVKTLAYNKVFCNVGQAYYPPTGVFTAPVRGVYFFTFTGFNNQAHPGALSLYHNSSRLRHASSPSSQVTYFSNAVTVVMQQGDSVYVQLPAGHTLFDDASHSCTLTGFLLYTL